MAYEKPTVNSYDFNFDDVHNAHLRVHFEIEKKVGKRSMRTIGYAGMQCAKWKSTCYSKFY